MYELLVELDIEIPTKLNWLTDSGSDEVAAACVVYNGLHLAEKVCTEICHGRGPVGHNHTFLDYAGNRQKAESKGNKDHTGTPAYTDDETDMRVLEAAKKHHPGYICRTRRMVAALDFSPITELGATWTGQKTHRMMKMYVDSGTGGIHAQVYADLASAKPKFFTLDGGGIAADIKIIDDPGDLCKTPLGMAPHSEKGIERAKAGVATIKKVLARPVHYGLRIPKDAQDRDMYFAARIAEADKIWIPSSATDQPPGFKSALPFPAGLKKQSPTFVMDSVSGSAALTPSLCGDAPHAGKTKILREAFCNPEDIIGNFGGVPAFFVCDAEIDDDGSPSDPYVAAAQIVGIKANADRPEESLHKIIWYNNPAPIAGRSTG